MTREVTVKTGPLNNIEFSQLRGKVTGRMVKLSPSELIKGGELIIKLKAQDNVVALNTLERSETTYSFMDVMPGDYEIEIQSNKWCFEEQVHSISVTSADTQVPDFVQSGFKIKVMSSHETKAKWRPVKAGKDANMEITFAKGENTVCLPNSTTFEFEPFSCHGFEKEYYTCNPSTDEVLRLTAVTHEVSGFVMSSNQVNDLLMDITYPNGQITRWVHLIYFRLGNTILIMFYRYIYINLLQVGAIKGQ